MLVETVYIVAKYLLTALGHNSEFWLECVHISRSGKRERDGAGGVRTPRQYTPK